MRQYYYYYVNHIHVDIILHTFFVNDGVFLFIYLFIFILLLIVLIFVFCIFNLFVWEFLLEYLYFFKLNYFNLVLILALNSTLFDIYLFIYLFILIYFYLYVPAMLYFSSTC